MSIKHRTLNDKPLIICLIGESASGKTRAADFIEAYYGIKMIQSYTDRAMRPSESQLILDGKSAGHTFVSKEDFDCIDPMDMISYTSFGNYRYCCTKQDVADLNVYVIDEFGVNSLKTNHSDKFNIVSIRIKCDEQVRLARAGEGGAERVRRDLGKFNMPDDKFDFIIDTTNGEFFSKNELEFIIDQIIISNLKSSPDKLKSKSHIRY